MTRTDVISCVDALVAAWNAQDVEKFVSFLTEDIWWHDLGMPAPPIIGRTEVQGFVESILLAFPDMRYELRGSVCISDDGISCVVPWVIHATNTGYLTPPGFAPTGRRVRLEGLDYLTFRDGLVARIETRFDPAELVEQLFGLQLRPRPGSMRERALVLLQRVKAAWIRRRDVRVG